MNRRPLEECGHNLLVLVGEGENCTGLPLKVSTSSFQWGIDFLHGPHHVAQKSITITLPRNASKFVLASAGAWSTLDRFSGGAGFFNSGPLTEALHGERTAATASAVMEPSLLRRPIRTFDWTVRLCSRGVASQASRCTPLARG